MTAEPAITVFLTVSAEIHQELLVLNSYLQIRSRSCWNGVIAETPVVPTAVAGSVAAPKYSPAGDEVVHRFQEEGADVLLLLTDEGLNLFRQEIVQGVEVPRPPWQGRGNCGVRTIEVCNVGSVFEVESDGEIDTLNLFSEIHECCKRNERN